MPQKSISSTSDLPAVQAAISESQIVRRYFNFSIFSACRTRPSSQLAKLDERRKALYRDCWSLEDLKFKCELILLSVFINISERNGDIFGGAVDSARFVVLGNSVKKYRLSGSRNFSVKSKKYRFKLLFNWYSDGSLWCTPLKYSLKIPCLWQHKSVASSSVPGLCPLPVLVTMIAISVHARTPVVFFCMTLLVSGNNNEGHYCKTNLLTIFPTRRICGQCSAALAKNGFVTPISILESLVPFQDIKRLLLLNFFSISRHLPDVAQHTSESPVLE